MTDQAHGLGRLWRSMMQRPRLSQVVFGAWVLLLMVAAAYSMWRLMPDDEFAPVFGGQRLSMGDQRRIELALARQGLNTYRVKEGQLHVPAHLRTEYLSALESQDALPRDLHHHVEQLAGAGGIFDPPAHRRQRLDWAREHDLATMIETMPDIADATVIFDERVEEGLPPRRYQSATVGVVCRDDWELTPSQIRAISDFVCGARAGLTPENVTVADLRAGRSAKAGSPLTEIAATPLEQLRNVQRMESAWHDKILATLDHIVGIKIAVSMTSELDPSAGPADGELKNKGWLPRPTSLSINIPRSYVDRIYVRHIAGREIRATESRELWTSIERKTQRDVRETVVALLGGDGQHVSMHVATYEDLAALPMWDLQATWQRLRSAGFWQRYGVPAAALALLALTAAWSWSRGRWGWAADGHAPADPDLSLFGELPLGDTERAVMAAEPHATDEESRDELVRVVRHDPDRAAQVLTQWIREAG